MGGVKYPLRPPGGRSSLSRDGPAVSDGLGTFSSVFEKLDLDRALGWEVGGVGRPCLNDVSGLCCFGFELEDGVAVFIHLSGSGRYADIGIL